MTPLKSPLQLTAPPTLEKKLEALVALRTLQAQDEELVLQRRAEIVTLRRDFELLQRDVAALGRRLASDVRSDVLRMLRYNLDQPRVPKSLAPANSQSDSSAASAYQKAAADDLDHPGWPAGAADGKGGQFRPKDSNGAESPINSKGPSEGPAKPGAQHAALETGTQTDANHAPNGNGSSGAVESNGGAPSHGQPVRSAIRSTAD